MARIKLIVTGDMEKQALPQSLKRFFPSQRNGQNVIWETPHKVDGVTCSRLDPSKSPSERMKRLVKAMLAEATIGSQGTPADLVLVLDDVELHNLGQESIVTDHFKKAIEMHLSNLPNNQLKIREIIRNKCSFHLLKPMIESYLFGDLEALSMAGVPASTQPLLVHATDMEQFESNDPQWLPNCYAENEEKKKINQPWWRHECHAKQYLIYLRSRHSEFPYQETMHGKKSLTMLNWKKIQKTPTDNPIIHSLFQDIADWFGVQNPLGEGKIDPIFYPSSDVNPATLLLRNM
ncbi:MAG: hypothetical protein HQL99_17175 [Magnetococcales bacterium]|nr:hypothetical protein [Magnetococcales bacterium]